jgi:signal peptidase II
MTQKRTAKSGYVLFFGMAILGLTLDLASKSWIFADRGMPLQKEPIWLIPDVFSLETSLNEGALFGMGAGWGLLFIALSIAAMVGIVYWIFWGGAAHDWLLCFALGGILAGILGNLYDRLGLPGLTWTTRLKPGHPDLVGERVYAVRDFLHFQYDWFDWPIFNLADSMLVCGVAFLIFHAYVLEPRAKGSPAQSRASEEKAANAKGSPRKPAGRR